MSELVVSTSNDLEIRILIENKEPNKPFFVLNRPKIKFKSVTFISNIER